MQFRLRFYVFVRFVKPYRLQNEYCRFVKRTQNIVAFFVNEIMHASVINIARTDFYCTLYRLTVYLFEQAIESSFNGRGS